MLWHLIIKCWKTNMCVSLQKCRDMKERLLSQQRETQASLERLRALIRLIQRDHMIQVTMTATTTTSGGAALLSLPWIKPSSTSSTSSSTASPAGSSTLLHKSVLHSQGNNWAHHRQKHFIHNNIRAFSFTTQLFLSLMRDTHRGSRKLKSGQRGFPPKSCIVLKYQKNNIKNQY